VPDLAELQKIMGITFTDLSLLEQAVVHSSYINENPGIVSGHNERLEFLGDAVLDYVITDKLYREYPDADEGQMTRLRASLVRGETLANAARSINLGDFLYMGRGEESSGGRDKTTNLAGALEAVIAAIYLDRGEATAKDFVLKVLEEKWDEVVNSGTGRDFKSRLQEVTQSRFQVIPSYRMLSESGPDHDKTFTVEVTANHEVLGRGTGKSKKTAEMEAARAALKRLDNDFTQ
jgi:ribonuclease-3